MRCRICKSKKTIKVLDLGKQPLANKYPKNKLEIKKEKKFNLEIIFCKNCRSGQIKKIIDRNLMFEDYYYLSSVNEKLKKHFEQLSNKLKRYKFVVDIGSNDGILLKPLKDKGIKAIGIDPSKNVGKIANDKGLETFIGFFNKKIIKKILNKYPKPDLVVASSVITHMEKPREFANNIKDFLCKNGDLIIEIEYLQNFIKNIEFERFYFDRPFYYSANSINLLFKEAGMTLYDIQKINAHGGSLRCYIKNSKNFKKTIRCNKILKEERSQLNVKALQNFNKKIYIQAKKFRAALVKLNLQNKYVIGYGAPARVSTLTNVSNIDSNLIKYIIDDSPLKQNRFSPGKHIKINERNKNITKKIDIVIVFAYEYFKEIRKKFNKFRVKFYKPIPFSILK